MSVCVRGNRLLHGIAFGPWSSVNDLYDLRVIGNGRLSTIFSGRCKFTRQRLAVKVYHKELLDEGRIQLLRNEISCLKAMAYEPGVCQLYGAWEDDVGAYLIQELCRGGDLLNALDVSLLQERDLVRRVLVPLLVALRSMHARGMVHRDIKPENILLDTNGHARVGDFGLALDLKRFPAVERVGTLDYMAPEVLCMDPSPSSPLPCSSTITDKQNQKPSRSCSCSCSSEWCTEITLQGSCGGIRLKPVEYEGKRDGDRNNGESPEGHYAGPSSFDALASGAAAVIARDTSATSAASPEDVSDGTHKGASVSDMATVVVVASPGTLASSSRTPVSPVTASPPRDGSSSGRSSVSSCAPMDASTHGDSSDVRGPPPGVPLLPLFSQPGTASHGPLTSSWSSSDLAASNCGDACPDSSGTASRNNDSPLCATACCHPPRMSSPTTDMDTSTSSSCAGNLCLATPMSERGLQRAPGCAAQCEVGSASSCDAFPDMSTPPLGCAALAGDGHGPRMADTWKGNGSASPSGLHARGTVVLPRGGESLALACINAGPFHGCGGAAPGALGQIPGPCGVTCWSNHKGRRASGTHAAKREQYDQMVDAWAVGVLTYEALVGESPFVDASYSATCAKILWKELPEYNGEGKACWPVEVSAEAADFIARALVKVPEERMPVAAMMRHPLILKHCPELVLRH